MLRRKKQMTKLEELIKELCPNGVPQKRLDESCNIFDNKRKPITKSAREFGIYPYYGANGIQDYVSDYIFDGTYILIGEDGSVITASGNPVVNWVTGKVWVNNHAHILGEKEGVLLRYLFHYIQTIDISSLVHGNIPKLTGGDLRAIQIPVPPIPVQEEIVRILDSFTELTAELAAELAARKKQYEYYRDKLLTPQHCELLRILDIATTNIGLATSVTKFKSTSGVLLLHNSDIQQNAIVLKSVEYMTEEFARRNASKILQKDDIITVHTGDVGTSAVIDEKYAGAIGFTTITTRIKDKSKITPQYLCHYLNSNLCKSSIASMTISDRSNLNQSSFEKLVVPVPPLETQNKIVQILDNFDSICSDLKIGLPAEIEARKKQYEFYRDKLLSF